MPLGEWDPKRGRGGRQWRRLVDELVPPGSMCESPVCRFDDREIWFGVRRNHPRSRSLDHIVPLSEGGHPTARWNLRPAHFGCNSAKTNLTKPDAPRKSRAYPF